MSQVTLPSSWALLLCACAERWEPSCSSFRLRFGRRKCRRMQNTTSVNLHLRPFPAVMCFQSSNRLALPLPDGHSGQDRFLTNAAGGTPATASHARMTMTVAGLPSRRQESTASPLSVAPPFFTFPVAGRAISHTYSFSFPPLQVYANVPMPPFQTASVVIFVAGAKVKTGLGTQIF